jgi:hypothetical protein
MTKIAPVLAALLVSAGTAMAEDTPDDIVAAWKCGEFPVELHRLGVHMFALRLEFNTESRDTKTKLPTPLYFNHAHNGEPIGRFDLRFDKIGAILNGKRCRISCTSGKECE